MNPFEKNSGFGNQDRWKAKLYTSLSAILLTALLHFGLTACTGHPDRADSEKEAEGQIWTCPMHPSIRSPKPGSCPICGMDLVPAGPASTSPKNKITENPSTPSSKEKSLSPMAEGSQIYIDPEKQKAISLTYGDVTVRSLHRQARAPLRLEPDPSGLTEISIKGGGGFVVGGTQSGNGKTQEEEKGSAAIDHRIQDVFSFGVIR
jgi:Cu(I)/Ag(I) efflux system membrane fusion protein